jgi:hypothetical protein
MKQNLYFPAKRRIGRQRRDVVSSLTLVAATYDVGSSITLKFNQPIDISQLNGPAITVNDSLNGTIFVGLDGPATRVDAFTVRLELEEDGPFAGQTTTLDATDDTDIRSVPGAQSWAGVTELPLPYP